MPQREPEHDLRPQGPAEAELRVQAALATFARNLLRHTKGILNRCRYPINKGCLEGIKNKINVIKRQAYGFRDDAYFILKIKGAFPGTLRLNPRCTEIFLAPRSPIGHTFDVDRTPLQSEVIMKFTIGIFPVIVLAACGGDPEPIDSRGIAEDTIGAPAVAPMPAPASAYPSDTLPDESDTLPDD